LRNQGQSTLYNWESVIYHVPADPAKHRLSAKELYSWLQS